MKREKSTNLDSTNSTPGNCQTEASPNRGLIGKRSLLAAALMLASLTVFLWGAGGISYGDSARSTPLKVTANAQFYPTFGTPNDALVTDDGANVLVSVTGETTPCPGKPSPPPTTFTTGVQVFSTSDLSVNPCGGQQIINFPSSHRLKPVGHIDGMQFFPGSPQVSVGAAIERQGAEFFRLASLSEPCGVDGVIQVPQYPIYNCDNCPDCAPGTFDVAVTPDGHYAFVANEYGQLPSPTPATEKGGGTVGVIMVERDAAGGFTRGTRPVEPNHTIYIPGGDTIPGITMSHDGRYLYVACEGSAEGLNPDTQKKYRDPTGFALTRNGVILCPGCRHGTESCDNEAKPGRARNGLLAVIDVDMAVHGAGQAAIKTIISAGCNPVRAVETADGKYLFVAARGRNTQLPMEPGASGYNVFAFDIPMLLSASPNDAFLGYGDSGGTAPVGIALFNKDTLLAVANSNRFYGNCECTPPPPPHPACLLPPDFPPCTASVAILDVSNPAVPTIQQIIPNPNNPNSPDFPRNVTVGPDDSTLYVPNANAKTLEVITTSVK